jgi:hypothetical protein
VKQLVIQLVLAAQAAHWAQTEETLYLELLEPMAVVVEHTITTAKDKMVDRAVVVTVLDQTLVQDLQPQFVAVAAELLDKDIQEVAKPEWH